MITAILELQTRHTWLVRKCARNIEVPWLAFLIAIKLTKISVMPGISISRKLLPPVVCFSFFWSVSRSKYDISITNDLSSLILLNYYYSHTTKTCFSNEAEIKCDIYFYTYTYRPTYFIKYMIVIYICNYNFSLQQNNVLSLGLAKEGQAMPYMSYIVLSQFPKAWVYRSVIETSLVTGKLTGKKRIRKIRCAICILQMHMIITGLKNVRKCYITAHNRICILYILNFPANLLLLIWIYYYLAQHSFIFTVDCSMHYPIVMPRRCSLKCR